MSKYSGLRGSMGWTVYYKLGEEERPQGTQKISGLLDGIIISTQEI
jgi:hypothetical protein